MITTPETMPSQLQMSYDDKLLATETPGLIHNLAVEARTMPDKHGRIVRRSRYTRLPTFTTPLRENGEPIAATVPQRVDIDAKISYYGYTAVTKSSLIILNAYDAIALG